MVISLKWATFLLIIISLISLLESPQVQTVNLEQQEISVFVMGEVKQAQKINIVSDAQVKDLLKQIELTEKADITQLDLNQPLVDEMVVMIPFKPQEACISINQANQETLEKLNGVGPSTAQKIIEYREINGPFLLLEDILNVDSIGLKKFEKMKSMLCL